MDKQKLITPKTEIVIYGAGEYGEKCALELLKSGSKVIGFLDKKKEGYSLQTQLPIYLVDKAPWDKAEKVVIIGLANGNSHLSVVKDLFALGYRYFLFLPLGLQMSYEQKKDMTKLYGKTIRGNIKGTERVLNAEEYIYGSYSDKDCLIEEYEDEITAWVSSEIIFAESFEKYPGDKTRLPKNKKIFDAHVTARKGYFELFDFFSGQIVELNNYLENYFELDLFEKKQEKLLEREKLYKIFQKEFERGNIQFFIDGAPMATWNKRGYFNLVGGHHRTIFLLHKGFSYCPIKMSKKDYEIWKNDNQFEKLIEWICSAKEQEIKSPIPNPYFNNVFSTRSIDDISSLVLPITSFLLENMIYENALDISEYDGFFARLANRAQIPEVTCFVNEKEAEKVKLINEMLYVDNISVDDKDVLKEQKLFDLVFAMNYLRTLEENSQKKVMKHLDEITKKVLIIEIKCKEEKDTIISYTNFSAYKLIQRKCKNGELVEVGAFIKE